MVLSCWQRLGHLPGKEGTQRGLGLMHKCFSVWEISFNLKIYFQSFSFDKGKIIEVYLSLKKLKYQNPRANKISASSDFIMLPDTNRKQGYKCLLVFSVSLH